MEYVSFSFFRMRVMLVKGICSILAGDFVWFGEGTIISSFYRKRSPKRQRIISRKEKNIKEQKSNAVAGVNRALHLFNIRETITRMENIGNTKCSLT